MRHTAALALLALVAVAARAAPPVGFSPVPPAAGQATSPFELQIVKYDGAVNGELVVDVRNTSKRAQRFVAQGLYFIPQVAADTAPQRLGAPGPLQTQRSGAWTYADDVVVEAGAIVRVRLDVFCIDSQRPSPTSDTPFALATSRLPPELARNISVDAKKAAERVGGYAAPAAKASMQSEVWKNRDQHWIKLEGEGAQEADK